MSDDKHTPTPWAMTEYDEIVDAIGTRLLVNGVASALTPGRAMDEGKTNAAFIVKAVNAHDDLMAALQKIVNNWDDLHPKDRQQARAALAKVAS